MHRVYAFGSNGAGQLGVGHFEDRDHPQVVQLGDDVEVKHIASGGNHTLFLLGDGRVRASGNNEFGQCIQDRSAQSNLCVPAPISDKGLPDSIEHVAATWNASIFATRDGQVFVVGQGLNGELGLGSSITECSSPLKIPSFPPHGTTISSMSSCMAHTVCVLSNGEVYGWGRGRKGQLGAPNGDVWRPRRVDAITFGAVSIACGKDFSCILGDEGQVLMLGPEKHDRFGIKANAPACLTEDTKNVRISASWGSVFVTSGQCRARRIHAWGRNDRGQLGPIDGAPPIQSLAAGSEHGLALTILDEVISWGWGEHGNCGLPIDGDGDVKGRWNSITLPHRPLQVFAGCATSFIVAESEQGIVGIGKLKPQSNIP